MSDSAKAQVREPEVKHEMARLDEAIGMLSDRTTDLGVRLNIVQRQELTTAPNKPEEVDSTCEMAQFLRSQALRVDGIRENVNFQIDTLEI